MNKKTEPTAHQAVLSSNKPVFFGLIGVLVLMVIIFISFILTEKKHASLSDMAAAQDGPLASTASTSVAKRSLESAPPNKEQLNVSTQDDHASDQDNTLTLVHTVHTGSLKDDTPKNLSMIQSTDIQKTSSAPTYPQTTSKPDTLKNVEPTSVATVFQATQKPTLLSLPTWFDETHWETTHIVKPGETLFNLAQKYYGVGRLYPYLAAKNHLSETSVLKSGMTLKIVNPAFLWHKVQAGETLYGISKHYYGDGKWVQRLIDANDIEDGTVLSVGSELLIPAPFLVVYIAKPKDTFASISEHLFGTKAYAQVIMEQQRFPKGYTLKVGDTLFITLDKTLSAALKKESAPLALSELGFPSTFRLIADRSEHILKIYENDRFIKAFPIAVGRLGKETPEGQYRIITKLEKPYYRTKHIAGGDPNNPLGSHWLGLDVPGTDGSIYGLHGTNDPDSIGKNVSAGCIRLYNEDVQWLYEHLPLGTDIIIR